MSRFSIVCLACAGSLLAHSALAQQVQVYSDGKPYLQTDAANATRARAPDERKARVKLSERPDAERIAAAHAAAFLHCGLDEAGYPAVKAPVKEELDYFIKEASFVPVPNSSKLIVIGEYGRGKAVVDVAEKLTVITPQCPAGVRTLFWSPGAARVVFATQHVDKIAFHGDSQALWTASFAPAQDVFVLDTAGAAAGPRKLMSLPNEKVLDVLVPDSSEHLWVLSQSEKTDWRGVRKIWRALLRTPDRTMTVHLRKVDLGGKTLEDTIVAAGVALGSASFVRE